MIHRGSANYTPPGTIGKSSEITISLNFTAEHAGVRRGSDQS